MSDIENIPNLFACFSFILFRSFPIKIINIATKYIKGIKYKSNHQLKVGGLIETL